MPEVTAAVVRGRLRDVVALVREERARRGLALRPCAKDIGISFTTLCGIENGRDPDTVNLLLLLTWLGLPLSFLTGVGDVDPAAIYRRGWDDCAATVRAALDASDRAAVADA
jgi:transcriptional regulator with XRE-family HTH domain